MRVRYAAFVKSVLRAEQGPADGRPECAFAGRSNVGKSTLLNTLLNRKGLAKTSKRPGKTQTINFFDVNGRVYFVDLPGYGYAKAPKDLQRAWGQAITAYLTSRKTLRLVVHLIDARHDPNQADLDLITLLEHARVPTLIVATKVDKLKASDRRRALKVLRDGLGLDEEALVIPFSAITKEGLGELWSVIDRYLQSCCRLQVPRLRKGPE